MAQVNYKEQKPKNRGSFAARLPNRKILRFPYREQYDAFCEWYSHNIFSPRTMYQEIAEFAAKVRKGIV